jgi:hypothetical protein
MRRRSAAAVVLLAALALAGCDGDDDPVPDDSDTTAQPEDDADGADDPDGAEDDVALPDVATIDRDEVLGEPDPDTFDGRVASAAADLPDGWEVAVVADPVLGPYLVGLPGGATVWRVGDDLEPLVGASTDDAWVRYWEPILTEAGAAGDTSSLRAAAVLPDVDGDGTELHLTINATPQQDLPVEDPAAVAGFFADTFRDQQLDVEEVTTGRVGDDEVGAVTMVTPDDEFEDGVPRRLRQWFYPEAGSPVLWSITCEGPVTAAEVADETCPVVLASFRSPLR